MQALFELKKPLPFDRNLFENMEKTALKLLDGAEKEPYTQAIVLFSATGKEYSARIQNALSQEKTDETALIKTIKESGDTEIGCVLCMWQDHGIDIPSYAFRESLCALNTKNSEALMFVMTADGVAAVKMSAVMK
jgi:hypothetical protein